MTNNVKQIFKRKRTPSRERSDESGNTDNEPKLFNRNFKERQKDM